MYYIEKWKVFNLNKSLIFIKLLKNRRLEIICKETKNKKIEYNSKNIDFVE